jgi:hypothetical protein
MPSIKKGNVSRTFDFLNIANSAFAKNQRFASDEMYIMFLIVMFFKFGLNN